jgi:hypothetical protein
MATDYPLRKIWLPVEPEAETEFLTLQGRIAAHAKGAEFQVGISLFKTRGSGTPADAGELFSIANLIAFIWKIYTAGYGSGTPVLDTSDAAYIAACTAAGALPVEFDANASAADFINRTRAQITIYVPASASANVTAGQNYGVFTGATSERPTQPDWFGNHRVESKEVGLSTVATPPTPAELYVRSDVYQADMANRPRFGKNPAGKTITLVSRSGRKGRNLGCDDNGQGPGNLETYS